MNKISVFFGSFLILALNIFSFHSRSSLKSIDAKKVNIKQAANEAGANCTGGGGDCLARHKDS